MGEPAAEGAALTKARAQQRVDQIEAFARELGELEREGVLRLEPGDRARVDASITRACSNASRAASTSIAPSASGECRSACASRRSSAPSP